MKVFLFVSKQKKLYKMYMPYLDALNKQLDIVKQMADADIVLIVGAWTIKGAQLARQARKMGIPYIVCPLGDVSEEDVSEGKPLDSDDSDGENLLGEKGLEYEHFADSIFRI